MTEYQIKEKERKTKDKERDSILKNLNIFINSILFEYNNKTVK